MKITVWKNEKFTLLTEKNISSNQLFRKNIDFTKFLSCIMHMRVKIRNFHIAQWCGKMKNTVSPKNISSNQLFSKKRWFHEIFVMFYSKFPQFQHCIANEKFGLTKKYFVKSTLIKKVDFTKFLSYESKFPQFPHIAQCGKMKNFVSPKNIP